jgi:hypothetical protein
MPKNIKAELSNSPLQNTHEWVNGLSNLIEIAENEAARGCGQSDVLYESRVQAAYAQILAQAPDTERIATEAALKARGYELDFTPYKAKAGECSLTGIDEDCCPCGRHE